jgi:hypothetical protein
MAAVGDHKFIRFSEAKTYPQEIYVSAGLVPVFNQTAR